jgi:putative phosphoribosyl transferase
VEGLGIPDKVIDEVAAKEFQELKRREQAYRDGRSAPVLRGQTIILVDDGLATGSTMRAATIALRQHQPAHIVVAVPVASEETCDAFREQVDAIVCAVTPAPFYAVGLWYVNFSQTTDEEVRELLKRAAQDYNAASNARSA